MGTRILLVDDEVIVRMVVERIFARRSEQAVIASSAREAIDLLGREPFDLVVTDIRMPSPGGAAVARAARERGIQVVLMTGYADSGDVQDLVAAGVPVVRKPFTPEQLLAAIASVRARDGAPVPADPDAA